MTRDPLGIRSPSTMRIYGPRSAWDLGGKDGTNSINNTNGNNTWTATAGNDSYVTKLVSDKVLEAELNAMLAELIPASFRK